MKTRIAIGSFLLGAFVGVGTLLCIGATPTADGMLRQGPLSLLPARTATHYSIRLGTTEYTAKSLRIEGNWVAFDFERPTRGNLIVTNTVIAPSTSVVAIEAYFVD